MKAIYRLCFLMIVPLLFSSGCYYYHSQIRPAEYNNLKSAHDERRVFILHYSDSVWLLSNVQVFQRDQDITGVVQVLPSNRNHFRLNKQGKDVRLRKGNLDPESELHLYVSKIKIGDSGFVRIPLSDIVKTEIYTINTSKTTATHVLAIGGAVLAVTGIVFAIMWQSSWTWQMD